MSASRAGSLVPLFLVSAFSVGYETALTRYFAVAKWSEYGYWIISIAMAGLALSGVAVALFRIPLLRHAVFLQRWLPVFLLVAAALGYRAVTLNPFNPLQLQNAVTWQPQLGNIGLYYLALLPFFAGAGLFISLAFVANEQRIPRIYGADLTGAGAGAILVLLLMRVLHPFHLVPALLALPLLAAPAAPGRRTALLLASLACFLGADALLLLDDHAAYNDFKAIYAPLHVPGGRVLATRRLPRGLYMLLDDFTERVDTDVTNNAGLLKLPGPPTTYGVYRDGTRIAGLPRPGPNGIDTRYAPGTLAALPYALVSHPSVLLAGPSGGFRVEEALTLGAIDITALEPDPLLRQAERTGLAGSLPLPPDPRIRLLGQSPVAAALDAPGRYTIIDLSADFLDEAEANAHAYTAGAIHAYLDALAPDGILSLPVSIREFPSYAVRMLATVRAGLLAAGVPHPEANVLVCRSAWNVRILVRRTPWTPAAIKAARAFADDRSFDMSYYPGIDVVAARDSIYNDLPAVSFERGEVINRGTASDAVADEALPTLRGLPTPSATSFRLTPITEDRPYVYDVLRLDRLPLLLRRIEVLPQAEIGPLVNVAVLAQALVLALLVLAVPALHRLFPRRTPAPAAPLVRIAAYFAALGLGFLFIEIAAIEKAAFLLNDRATAFALVLSVMLIGSGAGSLWSARFQQRDALFAAAGVISLWCILAALFQDRLILHCADWPEAARLALLIALLLPVSVALGIPFPLGLRRIAGGMALPWAWALNGAFSVVATPLATLMGMQAGLAWVLFAAAVLYGLCCVTYPAAAPLRVATGKNGL